MTRLVIFVFAGREANLEVQRPYMDRILSQWPEAELHLWDLTRTSADAIYLYSREGAHDGRVKVMRNFHPGHPIRCLYPRRDRPLRGHPPCRCMIHKPPYEKPYQWYARHGRPDTVYMKVDDDVLFLETDRLADLVDPVINHPERIHSALVVNNAVCAKYEPELQQTFQWLGNPEDPTYDKDWWALHISGLFATMSHRWFLDSWKHLTRHTRGIPFRTREGERISINCVAFSHAMMVSLAQEFASNPRLGDEGAMDDALPWIVPTFRAAHLTFGPQEQTMPAEELDDLRFRYAELSKEYLS